MVQRFYKIIVAFCLALYGPAVASQDISKKIPAASLIIPGPLIKYSIHPLRNPPIVVNITNNYLSGWQDFLTRKIHAITASIKDNHYTEKFGFFCKKELQLEKSTKIPLRFRVGSLDYLNAMEKVSPWSNRIQKTAY